MRQSGGQLSQGEKSLAALHPFEVILECLIDFRQSFRRTFQISSLFAPLLSQDSGQNARRAEQGDIEYLIDGIAWQSFETDNIVWDIGDPGQYPGRQSADPA